MLSPRPSLLPLWVTVWLPLAIALFLSVTGEFYGDFYRRVVIPEEGFLERMQVVITLIGFFITLRILVLTQVRQSIWLKLWFGACAIALFYVSVEEVSWGQQLFGWATPEGFSEFNDQNETNLHNTSHWLDQKPRLILELGVVIGGLIVPIALKFWPRLAETRFEIILPTTGVTTCALLAEFALLCDNGLELPGHYFFIRPSEVQEFYFYLFALIYLLDFRQRIFSKTRI